MQRAEIWMVSAPGMMMTKLSQASAVSCLRRRGVDDQAAGLSGDRLKSAL